MDDIEYLEEYEDLIMPGNKNQAATSADDESSSSIDQDIFESLFDNQSDEESDILSKKTGEIQKKRQERESLDSLDILVRDLGEQVGISAEGRLDSTESMPVTTKAIASCLKKSNSDITPRNSKSSDACTSSQEKPQKRVMFAKMSAASSSKTLENPLEPTTMQKPRDVSPHTKISDSCSQRVDKIESDLDSYSDVSDDSIVSISDIFTSNELRENEDRNRNISSSGVSTNQNTYNTPPPPPTPSSFISTANLPEKVTIISDTVLTRIEPALLESLVADDSKDRKKQSHKLEESNTIEQSQSETVETDDTSNIFESDIDVVEEIFDDTTTNITTETENAFNEEPSAISAPIDIINNELNILNEIENKEKKESLDLDIEDLKDKEKSEKSEETENPTKETISEQDITSNEKTKENDNDLKRTEEEEEHETKEECHIEQANQTDSSNIIAATKEKESSQLSSKDDNLTQEKCKDDVTEKVTQQVDNTKEKEKEKPDVKDPSTSTPQTLPAVKSSKIEQPAISMESDNPAKTSVPVPETNKMGERTKPNQTVKSSPTNVNTASQKPELQKSNQEIKQTPNNSNASKTSDKSTEKQNTTTTTTTKLSLDACKETPKEEIKMIKTPKKDVKTTTVSGSKPAQKIVSNLAQKNKETKSGSGSSASSKKGCSEKTELSQKAEKKNTLIHEKNRGAKERDEKCETNKSQVCSSSSSKNDDTSGKPEENNSGKPKADDVHSASEKPASDRKQEVRNTPQPPSTNQISRKYSSGEPDGTTSSSSADKNLTTGGNPKKYAPISANSIQISGKSAGGKSEEKKLSSVAPAPPKPKASQPSKSSDETNSSSSSAKKSPISPIRSPQEVSNSSKSNKNQTFAAKSDANPSASVKTDEVNLNPSQSNKNQASGKIAGKSAEKVQSISLSKNQTTNKTEDLNASSSSSSSSSIKSQSCGKTCSSVKSNQASFDKNVNVAAKPKVCAPSLTEKNPNPTTTKSADGGANTSSTQASFDKNVNVAKPKVSTPSLTEKNPNPTTTKSADGGANTSSTSNKNQTSVKPPATNASGSGKNITPGKPKQSNAPPSSSSSFSSSSSSSSNKNQNLNKPQEANLPSSSSSSNKIQASGKPKEDANPPQSSIKNPTSGNTCSNKPLQANPSSSSSKNQPASNKPVVRKSLSYDEIKRNIQKAKEASKAAAATAAEQKNPNSSKVQEKRRDSLGQQKSNTQTKIETKVSTIPANKKDNEEKKSNEVNKNLSAAKTSQEAAEKKEISGGTTKDPKPPAQAPPKPEDAKKPVNTNAKPNNNKNPKESDSSIEKKVVEVTPKSSSGSAAVSSSSAKQTSVVKPKIPFANMQRHNSSPIIKLQRSNFETKIGAESRKPNEKPSASVAQNKPQASTTTTNIKPTTTTTTNTNIDKNRPSLKRQNTTTTTTTSDNASAKKPRPEASSTESVSKVAKLAEPIASRQDTKNEKPIENTKSDKESKININSTSKAPPTREGSSNRDLKKHDEINRDKKMMQSNKDKESAAKEDKDKKSMEKKEETSSSHRTNDKTKTPNKSSSIKTIDSTSTSNARSSPRIIRGGQEGKVNENKGGESTSQLVESSLQAAKTPQKAAATKNSEQSEKSSSSVKTNISEAKEKKPTKSSSLPSIAKPREKKQEEPLQKGDDKIQTPKKSSSITHTVDSSLNARSSPRTTRGQEKVNENKDESTSQLVEPSLQAKTPQKAAAATKNSEQSEKSSSSLNKNLKSETKEKKSTKAVVPLPSANLDNTDKSIEEIVDLKAAKKDIENKDEHSKKVEAPSEAPVTEDKKADPVPDSMSIKEIENITEKDVSAKKAAIEITESISKETQVVVAEKRKESTSSMNEKPPISKNEITSSRADFGCEKEDADTKKTQKTQSDELKMVDNIKTTTNDKEAIAEKGRPKTSSIPEKSEKETPKDAEDMSKKEPPVQSEKTMTNKEKAGDAEKPIEPIPNRSSSSSIDTKSDKVEDSKVEEKTTKTSAKPEKPSNDKASSSKDKNSATIEKEERNTTTIDRPDLHDSLTEKGAVQSIPEVIPEKTLRKRSGNIQEKDENQIVENKETNKSNQSMGSGPKRQLRRREIEIPSGLEIAAKIPKRTIEKSEPATTSSADSKQKIDNPVLTEEPKKDVTRNKRRHRKKTSEENKIGQAQSTEKPCVSSENEISTVKSTKTEEEASSSITDTSSSSISQKEKSISSTILTEEGNAPEEPSDSLSRVSADSTAFSGFIDNFVPIETTINEKFVKPNVPSTTTTTTTNAEDNIDANKSLSSASSAKRLKTGKPDEQSSDASTVITLNEWLARKSGNILQENTPEAQPTNETQLKKDKSVVEQKKRMTEGEKDEETTNKDSNKKEKEEQMNNGNKNEETEKTTLKLERKRSRVKSEIEILKASMPKELRESGIDSLIASHSISPHCLTKSSVTTAATAATTAQTGGGRRTKRTSAVQWIHAVVQQSSSRSSTPVVKRLTTPTPTAVAQSKIINANANVSLNYKKRNSANVRRGGGGGAGGAGYQSNVKQDVFRVKCRNFRIRLNRSIVRKYLQNLKLQESKAATTSSTNQPKSVPKEDLNKGRKRKAAALSAHEEPQVKKSSVVPAVVEPPASEPSSAPAPESEPKVRGRPKTKNVVKTVATVALQSQKIDTASIESNQKAIDSKLQQVAATTSKAAEMKICAGGANEISESDLLLTPVSEAATSTSTIESSRRGRPKRPTATGTAAAPAPTSTSNSGRSSAVCSPILAITTPTPTTSTQNIPSKNANSTPASEIILPEIPNVTPKTEREDDYDSGAYVAPKQPPPVLRDDQTSMSPLESLLSGVSPSPSSIIDSRTTSGSAVPLIISGATSYTLPPLAIDNAGTRIYSFLHPTKYNTSHGYVMLDYCCPNLDGPMTAIDPTRRHAKVDAAIRELPAYITMETRLVTRAELEADSNALPASIRHKVQRITGGNKNAVSKITSAAAAAAATTSSISTTNLTSCNITTTTSVAPKATTALVSAQTTSSTSSNSVPSVSASVSALQKQLPSTTTLTPKTIIATTGTTTTTTTNKTTIGNTIGNTAGSGMSPTVVPTATITPTTLTDLRMKLRVNLKKFDLLLKKHYPRISLLTFQQRQDILESLSNATQLLPRDIENATRLLQEYVTHMTLKTVSNTTDSSISAETSGSSTSTTTTTTSLSSSSSSLRGGSSTPVATAVAVTTSATVAPSSVPHLPPVTTRAHSKRRSETPSNMQRRSVPIYNSDKTVIGYQVQMVSPAVTVTGSNVSTANSTSFTTSTTTRGYGKKNTTAITTSSPSPASSSSSTATPRSGVFVIDKGNVSAPSSSLISPSNTGSTPRSFYQDKDIHSPTNITQIKRAPQASSTPLSSSSSSGSIVTRSGSGSGGGGSTARVGNRNANVRQVSLRGGNSRIQSTASITPSMAMQKTSSTSSVLPRLPTLTRNPHLPPLLSAPTQPTTPMGVRDIVNAEQQSLQKRLTRKTAAAELLVVNHDNHGNPLPPEDEEILPDENNAATTHIKREKPDEFPI